MHLDLNANDAKFKGERSKTRKDLESISNFFDCKKYSFLFLNI